MGRVCMPTHWNPVFGVFLKLAGSIALYPLDVSKTYAKVESIPGPIFIYPAQDDRVM